MTPSGYIASALGAATIGLGILLYLALQWGLGEHDRAVVAEHTNEINRIEQSLKQEKEKALSDLRSEYDKTIADLEAESKETVNGITRQLMSARQDALQKPIGFGDNFVRSLIRIDCLRSLGKASGDLQRRAACSREAERADPASAGIPVSVLKPDFLQQWGSACGDWPRTREPVIEGEEDLAYTEDDWRQQYGDFDHTLCDDSLVAFTPEFSLYLQKFLSDDESHIADLWAWGLEQDKVIDVLTSKTRNQEDGSVNDNGQD